MKKSIVLAMCLIIVNFCKGQSVLDDNLDWRQIEEMAKKENPGQGIYFESLNWEQIKAKAKAERKAIFIDFYTTWCGPCKQMDQNVYILKDVGDYMNKNFVSVKVQMDITPKDNDFVKSWYNTAKKMESEYKIQAYPTLLFLDSTGLPSFKLSSIYKPSNFVKAARMSLDPNSGFLGKLNQFKAGKRESGFVLDLVTHAQELGLNDDAKEIANTYLSDLLDTQLYTKDNLQILHRTISTSKDRGFQIFLNEVKKVEAIDPRLAYQYSTGLIEKVIRDETIVPFLKSNDGKPDWQKIKRNVKKWGEVGEELLLKEQYVDAGDRATKNPLILKILTPMLDKGASWYKLLTAIKSFQAGKGEERIVGNTIISIMNRNMNGTSNSTDSFFQAALYYEKNFAIMFNSSGLNNWAWFSFLKIEDKARLEKAIRWSEKSLELDPLSLMCTDTYANLLYKVGRTEEAIRIEEKLTVSDPNNNEFKDTLKKMKKGQPTWNTAN